MDLLMQRRLGQPEQFIIQGRQRRSARQASLHIFVGLRTTGRRWLDLKAQSFDQPLCKQRRCLGLLATQLAYA